MRSQFYQIGNSKNLKNLKNLEIMSKTNHVRLIGFLGANPKLVGNNENSTVLSVSIATHDSHKDEHGNKIVKTEWHNVIAFGKVADLIKTHTVKGSQVMIIGRLQTRQYLTKEQENRYVTEIICEEILFLGEKDKSQG
jgi:single-strand DNA-binding protein